MNDKPSFSTKLLQERLKKARGVGSENQQSPVEAKFAGLAAIDYPKDPYSLLSGLRAWPCYLYSSTELQTRREVLEWLIDHAQDLFWLDKEFSWSEQWHLELLSFTALTQTRLEQVASYFEMRKLGPQSRDLYERLRNLNPSPTILISWLRHLAHSRAWSEVVDSAERALSSFCEKSDRAKVYELLIESLLQRGQVDRSELSDAERALHKLFAVRSEGLWTSRFEGLLTRATEGCLPGDLKKGRAESTSILADAYRGMSRLGKWLGTTFGGRDAQVPYSEGVAKSAPAMLLPISVEKFLASSKKHENDFRQGLRTAAGDAEAAAVFAALSAGGFWTLAQIDDTVLKAISFSSSGQPESFWRLREIAQGTDDSEGALRRLSGYVAEQQVAADLTREGHIVELPEGPNQAGWDLLVDGHPVQVKCSMDPDYVLDHFERYPNIPVIVNAELAEEIGDHPLVWVDEGLNHADVVSTTEESVDALADFADADDLIPIPLISVAFAAVRNFGEWSAGLIDERTFAERVGVDIAARTAGGGAGSLIGGAVGSFLGPVGTVVGASLGGFIGSVAGGTGADAVNRSEICDARDKLVSSLGQFATWFRSNLLGPRILMLKDRHELMSEWAVNTSGKAGAPACVATFYAASSEMLARAQDLNSWIARREHGDDFERAHAGWVALREAGAFFHPELKTRLATVREAIRDYSMLTNPSHGGAPDPNTA